MGGVKKQKKPRTLLAKIVQIRNWKLFIILILLGFLAATLLRFNHIHMTELRSAVYTADEKGDDNVTKKALMELQNFTLHHIIFNVIEENGHQYVTFGTGPFYLEKSYERKAKAIIDEATELAAQYSGSNPNGNVYKRAADICDARGRQYGWYYNTAYANCFMEELAKYGSAEELLSEIDVDIPDPELYKYEFASPYWYPCLSGFVILLMAILICWIIIRIVIWIGYKIAIAIAEHTS